MMRRRHPIIVFHKEDNTSPRFSSGNQSGKKGANLENTLLIKGK
jgi:hypothetical protein